MIGDAVIIVQETTDEDLDDAALLSEGDATSQTPTTSDDPYVDLQLGLVQTLIFKLSGNKKISVNSQIIFSTILSIVDIITDILLFIKLWYQKYFLMASLLAIFDFIPGVFLLMHHYSSLAWSKSTPTGKFRTVLLFLLQPFALFFTHVIWFSSLSNAIRSQEQDHRHYLARLSALFHGLIEGPLNFILVGYMWSKGILPLPWQEVTTFTDSNLNVIYLGKITTTSLVFTTIGILKASVDVFEGYDDKLKIVLFSTTNILFRVLSFTYLTQFLDEWVISLFLLILIINLVTLLKTNEEQGTWIAMISSIVCSTMVPVMMTKEPHVFQKLNILSNSEMEEQKRKMKAMKKNACLLSAITNPIIFLADATVVILLNHTNYHHQSIWTDWVLSQWFSTFFTPFFFLTMISTWFLSVDEKESNADVNSDSMPKSKTDQVKKALKDNHRILMFVLAMIATITIHSIYVPKLNSAILGYVNSDNELIAIDVSMVHSLPKGCDEQEYIACKNIQFSNADYRKEKSLDDHTFYVDPRNKNLSSLPNVTYYFLHRMYDWKISLPAGFDGIRCKRCKVATARCQTYLHDIPHIQSCAGN